MPSLVGTMEEYLDKAENGSYTAQDQSVYYTVALLITAILGVSDEVAGIANESNSFNKVQEDVINVQKDVNQMQAIAQAAYKSYTAGGGTGTMTQQDFQTYLANNPSQQTAFQDVVAQFATDMGSFSTDANSLNNNYSQDGGSEALATMNMIMSTTGASGQTIQQDLSGGTGVGTDLYSDMQKFSLDYTNASQGSSGAAGTTFNNWMNVGTDGAQSLTGLGTDLKTAISNFDQKLNTKGTELQQDDQVGQNSVNSFASMTGTMVRNQKTQ